MDKNRFSIKSFHLPPHTLSFITTNYCTAKCSNCCMQCSPYKKDRLSLEEMINYVDDALENFPTIKLLVLTGGECFSLKYDLNKIVAYASSKGLRTRVVSNAYWASSFKKAYLLLKELKDVGLNELNLSTGDEHQVWIKYDNIVFAIVAAMKLDIDVVVNVETKPDSKFSILNMFSDPRLLYYLYHPQRYVLKILSGSWIEFNKSDKQVKSICVSQKRCTNLFDSITINQYHQMLACCGLSTKYIPYLTIGDLKKASMKFINYFQYNDFLKIWLFTEGPEKILDFCKKNGNVNIDMKKIDHPCMACIRLFNDPLNINIINTNYKKICTRILLKYFFLKESYVKQLKDI